jgi:aminopeptidase N
MVIARQWRPGIKIGGNDTSLAFTAMNLDLLEAVDALQSPVPTPDDQRFTPITYGKGAQVVRMMASHSGRHTLS